MENWNYNLHRNETKSKKIKPDTEVKTGLEDEELSQNGERYEIWMNEERF